MELNNFLDNVKEKHHGDSSDFFGNSSEDLMRNLEKIGEAGKKAAKAGRKLGIAFNLYHPTIRNPNRLWFQFWKPRMILNPDYVPAPSTWPEQAKEMGLKLPHIESKRWEDCDK